MTMEDTPVSEEQRLMREAKRRVDMKMGFLTHLLVFVLVNGGLYLLNGFTGSTRWHFFPLWGWGLGLTIHGIVTLIALQGSGLRERMMDQELRQLRERQQRRG